jgi:hypothetical protein
MGEMTPFVHVCKRDEPFFNRWLTHSRALAKLPDMVVWAEPGVKLDHKIDRVFESPYGYPEVCTDMWHAALQCIGGPVLYLEPDAWPCAPNWYEVLCAEYDRLGRPGAMVTASTHPPHDLVGGIGVYDASKLPMDKYYEHLRGQIPEGLAFDWWIGQQNPARTPLIRHSYGIYDKGVVVGFHAFQTREHFLRMCEGAAIFHKDAFGTIGKWVGPESAPIILPVEGATPGHVSETSKHRDWFVEFTGGYGIDVGYGGDPLVPHAICFDMPRPYTEVGTAAQHLGGDARRIPLRDQTLDWLYTSHLIEDFTYNAQRELVKEWLRVVKPEGYVMILAPDQQRFLAHCAATGQSVNDNHKEADYSLENFTKRVLKKLTTYPRVVRSVDFPDYSWGIILQRK